MKKILELIMVIILIVSFSACASTKSGESKVEAPSETYQKACELIENHQNLKAMQLLMSIYDYQDAHEKYNSLLLNNRISVGNWVGFIDDNGNVVVVGDDASKEIRSAVANWNDITAISSHEYGIIGLKKDGTVVSTPDTDNTKWYAGAEVVDGWNDIKQIACGTYHTVGLKSDGTVIATRYVGDISENKGQCNVNEWNNIYSIAAGSNHTVGLKKDGTVIAVGDNEYGQCDVESWTDIVSISACGQFTLGLKKDGAVLCTGGNMFNETFDVSDWKDIVYATIGYSHAIGLKADGTVVSVGSNNNNECDTQDWENIIYASAGSSTTVGVNSDGTIIFIGNESHMRNEINGYNLFSGQKGGAIKQAVKLPSNFPESIPLYNKKEIMKSSETYEATSVVFETTSSFEDTFDYYEKWCADRGGYLKQPYQDNLEMLISPMNDLEKAVTIIVTHGVKLEDGTTTKNPAVIIMLQGGDIYENVKNLK